MTLYNDKWHFLGRKQHNDDYLKESTIKLLSCIKAELTNAAVIRKKIN